MKSLRSKLEKHFFDFPFHVLNTNTSAFLIYLCAVIQNVPKKETTRGIQIAGWGSDEKLLAKSKKSLRSKLKDYLTFVHSAFSRCSAFSSTNTLRSLTCRNTVNAKERHAASIPAGCVFLKCSRKWVSKFRAAKRKVFTFFFAFSAFSTSRS